MFDGIAARYDAMNRLLSLGIDAHWRRRLVAAARPADLALDIATGTGDVALALAEAAPGAHIVGLDPSAGMLAVAARKVATESLETRVALMLGDALALPFSDGTFDAVTIAFGLRNITDRPAALAEMARVTAPGGRVAVLELVEPTGGLLAPLTRFHVHKLVPALGALLSGAREYTWLSRSIAAFPPPHEVVAMMRAAGLHTVEARPMTFGVVCLFVGQR
jgi:demethylmenaquinone methyltransferase/2-methoxy-6-polyprenyl-1,4-benzoquinol methylase